MTVFCLDSHPIWRNVVIIYCNARVLFLGGAYIQRDNNAYAICKNFTSTHARNLAPQHFEVHFEDIYSLKMFKDTLLEKPKNTLPKSVIFFVKLFLFHSIRSPVQGGHWCFPRIQKEQSESPTSNTHETVHHFFQWSNAKNQPSCFGYIINLVWYYPDFFWGAYNKPL